MSRMNSRAPRCRKCGQRLIIKQSIREGLCAECRLCERLAADPDRTDINGGKQ